LSRLPIRARLTAAFALATMLVLVGAGLFTHVRLRADLDEALNAGLRDRAAAAATEAEPTVFDEPEERFVRLVAPDGRVLMALGAARGPVLLGAELREAASGERWVERRVAGIEGTARVLARPADADTVVVAGQSLEDRDDTLAGLRASFALGIPLAVVVASLLGWGLAGAGLAPVEAMRRRADEISLEGAGEQLPLPAARDEIFRLGETLNAMLDRLRRAFEREQRFVADASHELRTPIAVVKAELEGTLRSGELGPEARESLVAATEECDHLAQLAEDLLVLARAGDGRLPVRPEALALRPLLEGVRERFADRAAVRGRPIHVDAEPGLTVSADPLRLRQALSNLLDNALRHGEGDVLLSAGREGGGVELRVSDGGAGFPAGAEDWAFERFAHGDGARTGGSAGLGLAIVRAVAEAHGGEAAICPGPRTAVRLWLPDGEQRPASQHDLSPAD
jgi:two-component system, OmpR family, sensor kinase